MEATNPTGDEFFGFITRNSVYTIKDHIYLLKIDAKSSAEAIYYNIYASGSFNSAKTITIGTNWKHLVRIEAATTSSSYTKLGIRKNYISYGSELTIQCKNMNVIDLTMMFGEGNEASALGVADFSTDANVATADANFSLMFPELYYDKDLGSLGILSNTPYASAADFKAAMQGVMMQYPLR